MSCTICIEKYTKKLRLEILCVKCAFSCCKCCFKKYITDTKKYPQCISCHHIFDIDFLIKNLGKYFFLTTYKSIMEDILFDYEKSMLPNIQNRLKEQLETIHRLRTNVDKLQILKYLKKINSTPKDDNKNPFVKKCPLGGCRGFLSVNFDCSICETKVCRDCGVIIPRESGEIPHHICRAEDIANVKLLSDNTKPCPKCGEGIYKIDGCMQMFCTTCNTGFDWMSGKIITKKFNNPHYLKWRLEHERKEGIVINDGDVKCNRNIEDMWMIIDNIRINLYYEEYIFQLTHNPMQMLVFLGELQDYIIPKFTVNDLEDNEELRISYILGILSVKEFKSGLYSRYKKKIIKMDVYNVLTLFKNCIIDIMYRLLNPYTTEIEKFEELEKETEQIIIYCNDCFEYIKYKYSCRKKYSIVFNDKKYTFSRR